MPNTNTQNSSGTQQGQQTKQSNPGSVTTGNNTATTSTYYYLSNILIPVASTQIPIIVEDTMYKFKVEHKERYSNSKRLLSEIVTVVEEAANEFIYIQSSFLDRTFNYSQLVEFLDEYMADLQAKNVVTVFDVIGDLRNNSQTAMRNGKIQVLINFQAYNCINVTELEFNLSLV